MSAAARGGCATPRTGEPAAREIAQTDQVIRELEHRKQQGRREQVYVA